MKLRHHRKRVQRAMMGRAWRLIDHPILGRVWFRPMVGRFADYGPFFRGLMPTLPPEARL